jgi:hypothetical protein
MRLLQEESEVGWFILEPHLNPVLVISLENKISGHLHLHFASICNHPPAVLVLLAGKFGCVI